MRNGEATSYLNLIENTICSIRMVLTKDLVDSIYYDNLNKCKKTRQTAFVKKSPLYGHSQHAVEAFYQLIGKKLPSVLRIMKSKDIYNNEYWWIESYDSNNKPAIIDCTYGCYMDLCHYPYNTGNDTILGLSKKSRIVIERVNELNMERSTKIGQYKSCNVLNQQEYRYDN